MLSSPELMVRPSKKIKLTFNSLPASSSEKAASIEPTESPGNEQAESSRSSSPLSSLKDLDSSNEPSPVLNVVSVEQTSTLLHPAQSNPDETGPTDNRTFGPVPTSKRRASKPKPFQPSNNIQYPPNPFATKETFDKSDLEVEEDMRILRSVLPAKPLTVESPSKRTRVVKEEVKNEFNDDHCSTCLQRGNLMCCDGCPKSFHPFCTEEAFLPGELPEGQWHCSECRYHLTMDKKKKTKTNDPKKRGLFTELLQKLEASNPKIFVLPKHIRSHVHRAWMNPHTGEFVDRDRVLIKQNAKLRSSRKESNGATKPSQLKDILLRHDQSDTINAQPIKLNHFTQNGLSETYLENSDRSTFCFRCKRSDFALLPTSVMLSFTKTEENSEMIRCDDCGTHWHLGCLDPPLSSIPADLKEEEVIDMNYVKGVVKKYKGDPSLLEGTSSVLSYSMKKKWICPLHSHEKKRKRIINLVETDTLFEDIETEKLQEEEIQRKFIEKSRREQKREISEWLRSTFPQGLGKVYKSKINELYTTEIEEALKKSEVSDNREQNNLKSAVALLDELQQKSYTREEEETYQWLSSISAMQLDIAKRLFVKKIKHIN